MGTTKYHEWARIAFSDTPQSNARKPVLALSSMRFLMPLIVHIEEHCSHMLTKPQENVVMEPLHKSILAGLSCQLMKAYAIQAYRSYTVRSSAKYAMLV